MVLLSDQEGARRDSRQEVRMPAGAAKRAGPAASGRQECPINHLRRWVAGAREVPPAQRRQRDQKA